MDVQYKQKKINTKNLPKAETAKNCLINKI